MNSTAKKLLTLFESEKIETEANHIEEYYPKKYVDDAIEKNNLFAI